MELRESGHPGAQGDCAAGEEGAAKGGEQAGGVVEPKAGRAISKIGMRVQLQP